VLVIGASLTPEPEFANTLPLKELLDLLALELFEVEGRETIDRLDELLRVTLELLPVEGLEELILELLLVEGLEELILALLVEGLEELILALLVEGLEVLILALLVEDLEVLILELLVEGLEELTLELLLLEGLEELTLELEDLEELEDLDGAELVEADRLAPLDLLLLERDDLAITGPVNSIKAKAIENRIDLVLVDCFRVNMACLLDF
jgi:hypothetical protein